METHDVTDIEQRVIDIEAALADFARDFVAVRDQIRAGRGNIHRNFFGTLHSNVLGLGRRAERVAKALEEEFGFRR